MVIDFQKYDLDTAPYGIFEMSKISVNRIYQKYNSILDIFYHRNFHLYPQVSHFVTNGSIAIRGYKFTIFLSD